MSVRKQFFLCLALFTALGSSPSTAGGDFAALAPALQNFIFNFLGFVRGIPLPDTLDALLLEEQDNLAEHLLADNSPGAFERMLGLQKSIEKSLEKGKSHRRRSERSLSLHLDLGDSSEPALSPRRQTNCNNCFSDAGKTHSNQKSFKIKLRTSDSDIYVTGIRISITEKNPLTPKSRTVSGPLPISGSSENEKSVPRRRHSMVGDISSSADKKVCEPNILCKEKREKRFSRRERSNDLRTNHSEAMRSLIEIKEWSTHEEFQPFVCNYCAYVVTDAELANFVRHLDMKEKSDQAFWSNMVKCFASAGFNNGVPSQALLDALVDPMLEDDPLRASVEEKFKESLQRHKRMIEVEGGAQLIDLLSFDWDNWDDLQIAEAWTQSDVLRFVNMPPLKAESSSKSGLDKRISFLSKAFDSYYYWLCAEIRKQPILLERLPSIATKMITLGNFNGAYVIYLVFQDDERLAQLKDHKKIGKLLELFKEKKNTKNYRDKVRDLDSKGVKHLCVASFYLKDFASLQGNQDLAIGEKLTKAVQIGEFLQKMAQDQKAAVMYENSLQADPELLKFFMKLVEYKQEI